MSGPVYSFRINGKITFYIPFECMHCRSQDDAEALFVLSKSVQANLTLRNSVFCLSNYE